MYVLVLMVWECDGVLECLGVWLMMVVCWSVLNVFKCAGTLWSKFLLLIEFEVVEMFEEDDVILDDCLWFVFICCYFVFVCEA